MRVDQLQWCEHQFTRVLIGLQRLCVAFAAAVNQISTALLETVHGEGWTGAITQQALQPGAVCCLDTHPRIDREAAAVAAGSCALDHVFSVTGLQVAACLKGAQDAFAHVGLHGSDGAFIKTSCCMKNHTLRCRLRVDLRSSIRIDAL